MVFSRNFHLAACMLILFTAITHRDVNASEIHNDDNVLYFVAKSNSSTSAQNHTTSIVTLNPAENTTDTNLIEGFIAAGIAVVFFGSNFVPVKKFKTGDGLFFQWVFVSAIWIVGLVVNLVRHNPTFYPLSMLGGFLWATGNITVVPIIKTIGLGLGLCIWGSLNLLTGWASGRFGWFGIGIEVPNNLLLNYLGVGLAVCSVFVYIMVQSDVSKQPRHYQTITVSDHYFHDSFNEADNAPIITSQHLQASADTTTEDNSDASWVDNLTPLQKKLVGCSLAVIAGCLYGLNFAPCLYVQNNVDGASTNGLDYVFAHFCGIYITGTGYFVIYCIAKKNKPNLFPSLVLPAMISGAMWAVAQTAWFVANFTLQEAVSFPIITTGPGIIAAIWGVVVFKEIRGKRNLIILMVAFIITISGAVLSGLSKLDNL